MTRTLLRGWARDAQDKATRVPGAVKTAYERAAGSAKEAFAEAFAKEQEESTAERS